MIRFKQKKEGEEFTYRGHLFKTVKYGKDWQFRCYHCGIKNLNKRYRIGNTCEFVHKCKCKNGSSLYFEDLGKLFKK